MATFKPPSQIPLIFFITIAILSTPSLANTHDNSSPAPADSNSNANANYTPIKPCIAVIVAVLTTVFSITFLLLLYVKHCKRGNGVGYTEHRHHHAGLIITPSAIRTNSGIDRGVIGSLPIFRFGSLRGQKDGLECAVCLTKFEKMEVLRLLPKCKHAFHVECVDTWLDGHSTCPLCRYRVDPEDILLVIEEDAAKTESEPELEFRRVSGRHSSAGELGSCSLLENNTTSLRRSVDGGESVSVGCFDRQRKDGLLLLVADRRKSFEKRFEHRIIISAAGGGVQRRWSDVQPSDLLYLRSEMLISDGRGFTSGSSRPSVKRQQMHPRVDDLGSGIGSGIINLRSVSEITGFSGFLNRGENSSKMGLRILE